MGRSNGRRETGLWRGNLKESDYVETYIGDNIRMYPKEIGWEHVEWIYVTKEKDKWWAIVSMVMTFYIV
jgi:hypothetical protein